jgi:membrane protein
MKETCWKTYRLVRGFLSHGLWRTDISDVPWFKSAFYYLVRLIEHAATGFMEDQCLIRASALTYTSLLSLVPFLALMFAVLKGLGVQSRLEPLLLQEFTPASQEVVTSILEYVDRTNVSSLGVAGVVALLVTALMTLRNMEGSLNWIWKVGKGRSWQRTVSDYLSTLLIAPFCILVAFSLTTYFSSPSIMDKMTGIWLIGGFYRLLIKFSPFFVLWIAFTACYLLIPNTRVKIPSALLGGILGGTLWQLAQWGYVRYQFGVAKYNAIYGALSQLPILLVWIYISWVILLMGAEIAFAHQNLPHYARKKALSLLRRQSPEYLILRVLQKVGERFQAGKSPFTLEELQRALQTARSSLEPCLVRLREAAWIAPIEGSSSMVIFQRPPEEMPLKMVLGCRPQVDETTAKERIVTILTRADEAIRSALEGITVRDLLVH